mgnify:CR=1 FL=1
MALTQLQRLELNKRVDKIFHAPSNAPAGGHQPEIAFVTQMSGDRDAIYSSVKDAVASLKAHDKMFQNMRSNMVYWGSSKISSKVTPMSFILMGKTFEEENQGSDIVDKSLHFEDLCAYLKLYQARCRCILIFMDCTYAQFESQKFGIADSKAAKEQLNPFLKYRLLVITRDKMVTGSEIMMRLISE